MSRLQQLDLRAALDTTERDGIPLGQANRANHAQATGLRLIADLTDAYDLHAETILATAQTRAQLQKRAMLAGLGIQLDEQSDALVEGAVIAGLLTGLRMGLLLADIERDTPTGDPA